MAITVQLTDGVTTLDFGGATYRARAGTIDLGFPESLRADVANLHRVGSRTVAHTYAQRRIAMLLQVKAATLIALSTAVIDLQEALRKARDYHLHQVGDRWRLKIDTGSATPVYFPVQGGEFRIPPTGMQSVFLPSANPTVIEAPLTLEVDALGEGDSEEITNYVADPSFEVAGTALADWTESISGTMTATTARSTAQAHHGVASLRINVTDSTGADETASRLQQLDDVDEGEVWSFACRCYVPTLTGGAQALFIVAWIGAAGQESVAITEVNSGFVTLEIENITVPAGATGATIYCRGWNNSNAGVTLDAYFDTIIAVQSASLPTAWVSGRAIKNHFDDDGQAHLNYIDIHPGQGDYPAKLRLKLSEDQAHTKVWAGARQGGRQYDTGLWHEGEDFATWEAEPADASASGGAYGETGDGLAFDAQSVGTNTGSPVSWSHTCSGSNRLLIVGISARGASDAARVPSGVTYNGIAMSLIGESAASSLVKVSLWRLVAPATGANTVTATFSAGPTSVVGGAVSFTGAHQTTPVGTMASATGSGTGPSVAVAAVLGDIVIDVVAADGGADSTSATVDASQTQRWNTEAGGGGTFCRGAGSTEEATSASVTMSWTLGVSKPWAIAGVAVKPTTGAIRPNAANPLVVTRTVSSPPRGAYRVLARVRNPDGASFGLAIGYSYGGITQDPSVASHYTVIETTQTAWHILDIGGLLVPPEPIPDGATIGDLTLRLAMYRVSGATTANLQVDWVMLMPADFGFGFASKTSGTDVVSLDSISDDPGIALLDTSDVFQSRPSQEGDPPKADPDGVRVYVLFDDGVDATITDGAAVTVEVVPQFATVG